MTWRLIWILSAGLLVLVLASTVDAARQFSDENPPLSTTPTPTTVIPPTETPTALPPSETPTATPIPPGLRLNEFMPRPASNWNGNGSIGPNDEYIELYNASSQIFDLTGWRLADVQGSTTQYTPSGTIGPGEYKVYFSSETGIALNDTGDGIQLLTPDGTEWDAHSFTTNPQPDQA